MVMMMMLGPVVVWGGQGSSVVVGVEGHLQLGGIEKQGSHHPESQMMSPPCWTAWLLLIGGQKHHSLDLALIDGHYGPDITAL